MPVDLLIFHFAFPRIILLIFTFSHFIIVAVARQCQGTFSFFISHSHQLSSQTPPPARPELHYFAIIFSYSISHLSGYFSSFSNFLIFSFFSFLEIPVCAWGGAEPSHFSFPQSTIHFFIFLIVGITHCDLSATRHLHFSFPRPRFIFLIFLIVGISTWKPEWNTVTSFFISEPHGSLYSCSYLRIFPGTTFRQLILFC